MVIEPLSGPTKDRVRIMYIWGSALPHSSSSESYGDTVVTLAGY